MRKLATKAVLEEQKKQKAMGYDDAMQIAKALNQFTQWPREVALSIAASDAGYVRICGADL
eukprot:CAMPEP_0183309558 /NCGR_PEP_ID=MMETSP0160_2-20130417/25419_1 /TAXON_ID=2839 ORGANISM="Odontella Sinensis, Strain Grunow 1884" /NCGR_SAMPLE_ID=MMETSP0160_2 /ASSEMBLY_ACC=CAM_ASM_000250 /LENGTH=60 /DNA_ID=CAMNT_0025473609 /DNA_START=316 /DNA_END=498 /DNA_ORIENTATION=+